MDWHRFQIKTSGSELSVVRALAWLAVLVIGGPLARADEPASSKTSPYLFVGIYQEVGASNGEGRRAPRDCADYRWHQQPAATREEAVAAKKAFLADKNHYNPSSEILEPGRVAVVYEYDRHSVGYDCDMRGAGVITGIDPESVTRRLQEHVREYPKNFRSEPKVVLRWDGGGLYRKVTRNYDGLEIIYHASKSSNGNTRVLAQLKNPRPDQDALVFFRKNGKLDDMPVRVPAGGHATQQLGEVEHFGAALRWVAPEDYSPGLIQRLKNEVREQVTVPDESTKDGRIQDRPTAIGVRG